MIWWRSATHVARVSRSLKYDRPEVGQIERDLASSTPPSFASGWIESLDDDIVWRSKAQLQRGADRQTVGWRSASPPLRSMRFLCLSFRSKATWGDLRGSIEELGEEWFMGNGSKMIIRDKSVSRQDRNRWSFYYICNIFFFFISRGFGVIFEGWNSKK